MSQESPAFSAVLLVKARGGILFANPRAIEHTDRLTGATPGSLGTLDNLLDRLYPTEPARRGAARILHRALGVARRRGQVRLRVQLPQPGRPDRAWDVQIMPHPSPSEETYQMSFQPASALPETLESDQLRRLRTAASYARRVLDSALDGLATFPGTSGTAGAELDTLVAVIERSRGLLGTLEGPPGTFMNRPEPAWTSES